MDYSRMNECANCYEFIRGNRLICSKWNEQEDARKEEKWKIDNADILAKISKEKLRKILEKEQHKNNFRKFILLMMAIHALLGLFTVIFS